jgi:hypothetical protein
VAARNSSDLAFCCRAISSACRKHCSALVGAVVFLAGEESDFVTGTVIRVDGGMRA